MSRAWSAELRGLEPAELAQTMWRNSVAALPRLAAFADVMAPAGVMRIRQQFLTR
ncbi:hypothetical protein ACTMU2_08465 [Cupriavidus basilensis]